jgi:hypothetical protein
MAILLCDLRYTNVDEIQHDIQRAFLAVFKKKGDRYTSVRSRYDKKMSGGVANP